MNENPYDNPLTESDFQAAATALDAPVAAIKAVCEVEAPGRGFWPSGEPRVLFERHKFYSYTDGRFYKDHPDLCNPRSGGYGPESKQHDRLQRAVKLDRAAALKATSWGRFQILGINYNQAGFPTLQAFINAMYDSEQAQLRAFVTFVRNDSRLLRALRALDWPAFAEVYNGPGYRKHQYDTRLAAAFKTHGGAEGLA